MVEGRDATHPLLTSSWGARRAAPSLEGCRPGRRGLALRGSALRAEHLRV